MATFKINRVTALPSTLEANSIYAVTVGAEKFELYITGNDTTARRMLDEADVQLLISAAVSGANALQGVNNITERDGLVLTANAMIVVFDASDDPDVSTGAATYFYRHSDTSFTKIGEQESMDVVQAWDNITGRPSSSVADIDDAVTKRHAHGNITQLDKVGQSASGDLTYDGREYVRSGATAW